MLDDQEWRTLREVERRLVADDPRFLQSFDDQARNLDPRPVRRVLTPIAVVAAVLLGVLMLVAGSPAGLVGLAVIAGLMWITRRKP